MKIKENITLYICDHCGKKYLRKHACIAHEQKCTSNPDNFIACMGCDHVEKRQMIFSQDVMYLGPNMGVCYDNEERALQAFWCKKKEHWIYPATKVNNPIQSEDIEGEIDNEPMPKECEDIRYKLLDY